MGGVITEALEPICRNCHSSLNWKNETWTWPYSEDKLNCTNVAFFNL